MSPQPPQPRKARSGRRQFPLHGGTTGDWTKVMQDPKVQAALQDPGIRQALYHNLQGTVPGGMAALLPPEAPAPPGPPLHMDSGGLSIDEQIDMLRKEAQRETDITKKNDLQAKITRLESAKMNEQAQPSSPVSIGGTTIGGGTMSNIAKLGATGPVTPANTAAAMGVGALAGLGTTRQQGLSALVGAGTAGLLNFLIRKYSKKPGDPSGQQGGGYSGGQDASGGAMPHSPTDTTTSTGATDVPAAQAWNPGWKNQKDTSVATPGPTGSADTGGGPPGGLRMGTANSQSGNVISYDGGKTWVDQQTHQPWTGGLVANQTQIAPGSSLTDATPATTPPPAVPQTQGAIDTTTTTNVLGPAFMADQQKRLDQGLIRRGTPSDPAPGWDEKLGKNTGAVSDDSFMDPYYGSDDYGMAEGGPVPPKKGVLLRKPQGLAAVPVLHTTIVITPTKKGEKKPPAKKKEGGVIKPAKPNLLPPEHGPTPYGERPKKHGRVQVPRGFGAAIKGKRFGGIY